ncbi:Carcinoembryonic antigen-related cell adhesion molecule 3 [Pteropus alecto]|uniref:Carcinoembryonic antigen-related cell adhesion molecule 3 n=1 Tax=Pteropus alecto TaxID=9402 RepID=L5L6B2_PTEAL|nr:Carcinoembryonic antigen-related cell adhesion molecule 3 [Pteropus alecto]
MEPPSASAPRWCVPWMGVLLAVSLLTFWNPPATAQLTIVPTSAPEGKDVLLLAHNLPEDLLGYMWYKEEGQDSNRLIASHGINTRSHPHPCEGNLQPQDLGVVLAMVSQLRLKEAGQASEVKCAHMASLVTMIPDL